MQRPADTDIARTSVRWIAPLLLTLACAIALPACSDSGGTPAGDGGASSNADARADARVDSGQPRADAAPARDAAQSRPDAFTQAAPDLGKLTLFVNLGDSIAAGAGVAGKDTYHALLMNNDDGAYPAFTGKDLSTRFADIQAIGGAFNGATSANLVGQLSSVPDNPGGNTLVTISIGGNDLLQNINALISAAGTQGVADTVTANIDKVLAHFADKTRYPNETFIAILNVYDFTDAQGNIPADAAVNAACGQLRQFASLLGPTVLKNLDLFNQQMQAYAQSKSVLLADIHNAFLGHGFNAPDPAMVYYDAGDPTVWFQADCIHPNPRGHEAIRRVLWRVLTGE